MEDNKMRIGINVSNELLKQVKQIRPEVNVSQVCREALERCVEVARIAAAQAVRDGVDKHVDRLDRSVAKLPMKPDWEAYALDDARVWVRTVTPEVWERFIYEADFLRKQGRDEAEMITVWSQLGEGVKGFWYHMQENEQWFISQCEIQFESGTSSDIHDKAQKEYGRAWLGYVHEVRHRLERHRKDEYDRVMSERAEYLRSRSDPALPFRP